MLKLNGPWKKADRSNGNGGNNCVECKYVKATRSNPSGNCVEVSKTGLHNSLILVRDSKQKNVREENRTVLSFTKTQWTDYIGMLKLGVGAVRHHDMFLIVRPNGILSFTYDEWVAFMDGVHKGEFDLEETPAI